MVQKIVLIEDREIELTPMRGRKARAMVPRLLSLASGFLYAAAESGVAISPLLAAFSDPEVKLADMLAVTDTGKLMLAIHFVMRKLEQEYDSIETEIFPFLLGLEDPEWLEDHGDMMEVYEAVFVAIQYHLSTSFGKRVGEALKKLVAVEGEEGESPATAES